MLHVFRVDVSGSAGHHNLAGLASYEPIDSLVALLNN
jgi:hypothetical protein